VGTNGLLLVRAKSGNRWHYGFIDIGRFVVAYAQGKKERATLSLELKPE
jgi:hypothetical protein